MADDERLPDDPEDSTSQVYDWRVLQALELGLAVEQAEAFAASDGDLGRLRELVKKGWTATAALRVV